MTSIDTYAFSSCTNITSLSLDCKNVYNWFSSSKDKIQTLTLGEHVTSIASDAFSGCTNITSLYLDCENVSNWFGGNYRLNSLTLGEHVKTIANNAFSLNSLTSIIVENGNTHYDSRNDCNAIIESATNNLISGCKNTIIPNGVTTISDYAFYGCSGFTSITIPNSVISIGSSAFEGCSTLTSFSIPNSVTNIGSAAFKNCYSLTSVTIPNGVTSIYDETFGGCRGLSSVTIPNSVTSIGAGAFSSCSGLKSIAIPNSVTSIGASAFSSCSSLRSITIPTGVTSIESSVFSGCSSLSFTNIPENVTSIGTSAFYGCSKLTGINIPNKVTNIGSNAFYNCRESNFVSIGSCVTNIGEYAFYGCTALSAVYISDISAWCKINFGNQNSNPLFYAHHLYMNGKEVSKLVIPNGTDRIGAYAFDACESLTSVVIPNTVKKIGACSFRNCTDLNSVTCLIKTPFKIDESVFCCNGDYIYDTVYMLATLFVPRGRDNFYAQLDGWKKFENIQPTETQFTITYMLDDELYKVYEVQATEVVTPEPAPAKDGYIFTGWSEIPMYMPAENVVVYGYFTFDPDGIEDVKAENATEVDYYDIQGRKLDKPQKGINIIRYSDGTSKKVLIK